MDSVSPSGVNMTASCTHCDDTLPHHEDIQDHMEKHHLFDDDNKTRLPMVGNTPRALWSAK